MIQDREEKVQTETKNEEEKTIQEKQESHKIQTGQRKEKTHEFKTIQENMKKKNIENQTKRQWYFFRADSWAPDNRGPTVRGPICHF